MTSQVSPELDENSMTETTITNYELLPTGKPHISFSEMRVWQDCSYRHKLQFVNKIDLSKPGVHMDFGTAVHASCENFLKTKVMDEKIFMRKLHELWKKNAEKDPKNYTVKSFKQFVKEGRSILLDVPKWLDETFQGWEFIDAEHQLYETISEKYPHAFKGFIDGVIQAPGPRGKTLIWLLDWKTCSFGWTGEKKSDPKVTAQLVLYKNFWSIKTKTNPKDVRCGFVLLKRTAKQGKHCELVATSVGDVTTGRSLTVINNMLHSVKKGIAIKNRNSCKYCEYAGTEHCT